MSTTVVNSNALSEEVWGTFLDINTDVKPYLRYPVGDTTWDVNLQLVTDMVCSWIQSYCGRPFAPKTYDWRFDGWAGWNGAYIMLPHYPVLEIVSVIEYWGISGPHDLNESTPTNQVDGWQCVYNTGRLNRVFPGNVQKPWFPGSRNIEVVWTAGYNPIPPEIRYAALESIHDWWINTQEVAAIGVPANATSYDEPLPAKGPQIWEGVPERLTSLLDPYVTISMA